MTTRPPVRLSGQEFRAPGDVVALRQTLISAFRPHWHDFYEIVLTRSGRGHHTVDGRRVPTGPGHVLAVSPSTLHAVTPLAGECLELINVTFDAQALPAEAANLLAGLTARSAPTKIGSHGRLSALFDSALQESRPGLPLRRVAGPAVVTQIVVELARLQGTVGEGTPGADWLPRILDHMERHYARQLHTTELAALAHLSPAYFRIRFRTQTGRTVTQHLQHVRIRAVCGLLASTDLPVARIRRATGFHDPSHFARAFRQLVGCSPTAYRAARRQEAGEAWGGDLSC